jgi:hypothetical protein
MPGKGNNKREINLTRDPAHPTARRNAFEISRRLGGKALISNQGPADFEGVSSGRGMRRAMK